MKPVISIILAFIWMWACAIIGVEWMPHNFVYNYLMTITGMFGAGGIMWFGIREYL